MRSRTSSIAFLLTAVVVALLARQAGLLAARQLSGSRGLAPIGPADVRLDMTDRNTPALASFVLRNTGPDTVRVQRVETGCECASATATGKLVPPGGSIIVTLSVKQFDEYATNYRQQARVVADTGSVELSLAGSLPPPTAIRHRPARLTLDVVRPGEWTDNQREVVLVQPAGLPPPTVTVSPTSGVTVEVVPLVAAHPQTAEYKLVVRTTAGHRYDTASGPQVVTVETAHAMLTVPLFARPPAD